MKETSNVIVKNQFTNKNYSRHGSTPAHFVTDYTARDDATLTVYPTANPFNESVRAFDTSSKLRQSIDVLSSKVYAFDSVPKTKWGQTTSLEGRAFDKNSLSVSADRLINKADAIQVAFDTDHTVHKMVVSFNTEYLEKNNLLKRDRFYYEQSLKPAVDELKLRDAVQHGCNYLCDQAGYVKPEFLGSIQLDQMHAHAHVVMCETADHHVSNAKRWYDGMEFGTFNEAQLDKFRDVIEHRIEETKHLPFQSSYQHTDYENHLSEYEQRYANMDIIRDVMLSSATISQVKPENELSYGDKLVQGDMTRVVPKETIPDFSPFDIERQQYAKRQHVVEELSKRKQLDKSTVQKQLDAKLNNDFDRVELSPFFSAQLFDRKQLKKRKSKIAKLVNRVKELHEEQRVLEDRFDTSTQGYLYFRKLEVEYEALGKDEETDLIRFKVLPYYENRCGRDAMRLDRNRVLQFQPIDSPSDTSKQSFDKASLTLTTSTSELDKYIAKRDFFIESVDQFKNGYLHANDFDRVVVITKDQRDVTTRDIPTLRNTGSFSTEYVTVIDNMDGDIAKLFERIAVNDAARGIDDLIACVERDDYPEQDLLRNLEEFRAEIYKTHNEMGLDQLDKTKVKTDSPRPLSERTVVTLDERVEQVDHGTDLQTSVVNEPTVTSESEVASRDIITSVSYEDAIVITEEAVNIDV